MFLVADAAFGTIRVQRLVAAVLTECLRGAHTAGCRQVELVGSAVGAVEHHIPLLQRMAQCRAVHRWHMGVQQAGALQFGQDRHNPACAVHIFHMVFLRGGRHLAQAGHFAAQAVNVGHPEIHPGLIGGSQQMQNGIGAATHGYVQAHGVFESLFGGNRARQHTGIVVLVIALGQRHDQMAGLYEQILALGMCGQQRTIARQRKPQGLGQAVHRIGREHAAARTASGAGAAFHLRDLFVGHMAVAGLDHGVDQIKLALRLVAIGNRDDFACLHGAAGDENNRDVQAHCGHQHAGGDLVAVADAHQRIGAVGIDHVFHAVGNQVAAGQAVEHAVVAHGDAVVNGDGIELLGNAASGLHLACHQLAHVVQVHMAGHKLGERIGNGNDRLAKIAVGHTGGAPQGAGASHVAAVGGGFGAVVGHGGGSLGLTLSQISDDMPSCNVGHANKILIEDQVKSIMPKRSGIGLSGSTLAIIRAWPSGLAVNICGQESGACKAALGGWSRMEDRTIKKRWIFVFHNVIMQKLSRQTGHCPVRLVCRPIHPWQRPQVPRSSHKGAAKGHPRFFLSEIRKGLSWTFLKTLQPLQPLLPKLPTRPC